MASSALVFVEPGRFRDVAQALPTVQALGRRRDLSVTFVVAGAHRRVLANDPDVSVVTAPPRDGVDCLLSRRGVAVGALAPAPRHLSLRATPTGGPTECQYLRQTVAAGLLPGSAITSRARLTFTAAELDYAGALLTHVTGSDAGPPLLLLPLRSARRGWPISRWRSLLSRIGEDQGPAVVAGTAAPATTAALVTGRPAALLPPLEYRVLAAVAAATHAAGGRAIGFDSDALRVVACAGLPVVALHTGPPGADAYLEPPHRNLIGDPDIGLNRVLDAVREQPGADDVQACG